MEKIIIFNFQLLTSFKFSDFQVVTRPISRCGKEYCRLGQITLESCYQIRNKCGINMIFNIIMEIFGSCIMRCACEHEFVEKDGQCVVPSIFREMTTTSEKTTTTTDFIASR